MELVKIVQNTRELQVTEKAVNLKYAQQDKFFKKMVVVLNVILTQEHLQMAKFVFLIIVEIEKN